MKIPDINLHSPIFRNDPEATRQLATYTARIQEIFRDLYDNLHTLPVVSSAPVLTELEEKGGPDGKVKSDVKILDNATAGNRKIYYRFQNNLRTIQSA